MQDRLPWNLRWAAPSDSEENTFLPIGDASVTANFPLHREARSVGHGATTIQIGASNMNDIFKDRTPLFTSGPNTSVIAPAEFVFGHSFDEPPFRKMSGTSFSAPMVAGLLGELVLLEKNLSPFGQQGTLGVEFIRAEFTNILLIETIEATADPVASIKIPNMHAGAGRINAWKAALTVVNGGPAQPAINDAQPLARESLNTAHTRAVVSE